MAQGFGQQKAKPLGSYQIAANDRFLFAMDSSTGNVRKNRLPQPGPTIDFTTGSTIWEKAYINHLGN